MFVITGGSSGIGKALAKHLSKKKQHVLVLGRDHDRLAKISSSSRYIEMLRVDLTSSKGRYDVLQYLKKQHHLKGLIHCAGCIKPILPLCTMDEAAWRNMFEINLTVPFLLTQCLYKKLIGGRVLQVSSYMTDKPIATLAPYCISKLAVSRLTECWQLESREVLFANVTPGFVDTKLQAYTRQSKKIAPKYSEMLKYLKENNKLISPETVACFLAWLLMGVNEIEYSSKDWDIYDRSHHNAWLLPPHHIPTFNWPL